MQWQCSVPNRSMRFKALSGTLTAMDRRIAHHQALILFLPSLDNVKKFFDSSTQLWHVKGYQLLNGFSKILVATNNQEKSWTDLLIWKEVYRQIRTIHMKLRRWQYTTKRFHPISAQISWFNTIICGYPVPEIDKLWKRSNSRYRNKPFRQNFRIFIGEMVV